jgi:hypothetical protein
MATAGAVIASVVPVVDAIWAAELVAAVVVMLVAAVMQ